MSNALDKINADKREHIARQKALRPMGEIAALAEQAAPTRGFVQRLRERADAGAYGLITEVKKASPSKGLIRDDFQPALLARAYEAGGATCLSVLTDQPYFLGADDHLSAARAAVDLPVLRKDFMLDPYQVLEARAIGADCILLIMASLEDGLALEMEALAHSLGMDVLVEVHDGDELDRALKLTTPLIGINNRNLKTLKTDLQTTRDLAARVPDDRLLVSESGLYTPEDLADMARHGAKCFLIGESLMRQDDVTEAVRTLLAPSEAAATRAAE